MMAGAVADSGGMDATAEGGHQRQWGSGEGRRDDDGHNSKGRGRGRGMGWLAALTKKHADLNFTNKILVAFIFYTEEPNNSVKTMTKYF